MRSCLSFIISIFLAINLVLLGLLITLRLVILDERVPHKIIEQTDLRTILPELLKEYVYQQVLGRDSELTEAESQERQAEVDLLVIEVEQAVTEEEERQAKVFAKTSVSEIFSFLHDPDQENLQFQTGEIRPIAFSILVKTSLVDRFNLPFTLCDPGQLQADCVDRQVLAKVLEQVIAGELTSSDLVELIPPCSSGRQLVLKPDVNQTDIPTCFSQEQLLLIDKHGLAGLTREPHELASEEQQAANRGIPDKLVFKGVDLPAPLHNLRRIVSSIPLVAVLLTITAVIWVLLLVAMKGEAAVNWLLAGMIMPGIVFALAAVLTALLNPPFDYIYRLINSELIVEQIKLIVDSYQKELCWCFMLIAISYITAGLAVKLLVIVRTRAIRSAVA